MPVLSDPAAEFLSEGQTNAAAAKVASECTALSLADKGLEQLCGFDRFQNLSFLVLSRNKLTKIDNLNSNFRIRVLIAQSNQISTLKGSLVHMKFLQQLDLSHNSLRNLPKIVRSLEHFEFLENLNLNGNPCCEEADYRFTLIHAIRSLAVLDCHAVTPSEWKQAMECMHPRTLLKVGFGSTVPPHDGTERAPRESFHERKAYQEMQAIHHRKAAEQKLADNVPPNTFGFPTAPFPHRPPPPPGCSFKTMTSEPIIQIPDEKAVPEACPRRDVYNLSTVGKQLSNWKPLDNEEAKTISLEPAAYNEFSVKQTLRRPLQLQACSIRI